MCTSQIYFAQVQVLRYSTKVQTQLGLHFVPMFCDLPRSEQLRRPGAWQAHTPQVRHILLPPWSQTLSFLGAQLHLRCAICLFWGADLWLRPSSWMSTIQDPKKTWLATDSLLAVRYVMPPLGTSLHLSFWLWLAPTRLPASGEGWAGPQPASSLLVFAQSFVL